MDQPVGIRFDADEWVGFDALTVLDDWEPKDRTLYRKGISKDVVSAAQDWKFREGESCSWVKASVPKWATDRPLNNKPRHSWMLNNATRLAAYHRAGCINEEDYIKARIDLTNRYIWLCANTEPKRMSKPADVIDAFGWGAETIERKTDAELQADLKHDTANCTVGDLSAVDAFAARAQASPNGHKKTKGQDDKNTRRLSLIPASSYRIKAIRWAWQDRIAEGTFALLAGPEGIGKSTIAFWLAAQVTRGTLPGKLEGKPKNVIIAAKEDAWAMTIVPRLKASGADLDRVFNVAVNENENTLLSLPNDNEALQEAIAENDVALVIFDPLVSQLDGKLDSHKDSEIRQGLEPLKVIAETTGCFMIGLIHFNKGNSKNVLDRIMGSKAFTAVARGVHAVLPDDQQPKGHGYLMTVKNNLGRSGLPLLQYHIESAQIEIEDRQDDDDKYTSVGVVVWDEESHESAEEVYDRIYNPKPTSILSGGNKDERADALAEAIRAMVEKNGGEMEADKIMLGLVQDGLIDGNAAGTKRAQRARKVAGLLSKKATGERFTGWVWYISDIQESM